MTVNRVLVCAPLPPEFDRESGSRRVLHLLQFLREAGWAVSFLARNEAGGARHMRMLRQQGVAAYGDGDRRIDELLAVGRFDLALLVFWHLAADYLPRIRALSPATRVVTDSVDVHFLRQARTLLGADEPGRGPAFHDDFAREMVRELNAYVASDAVLTVSQKEADLLNDFLGGARATAYAVPDCEAWSRLEAGFAARRGILFLGNFRHPPNVDGLEYFAEQIAPRLDAGLLAEHPIHVVGNGVTDAVRLACGRMPGARLVGWVPSVLPYFERARVSVVPLRHGAGTKRKLIQGLMLGTPSVSSSIGAEGLGLVDRRHVLLADDAASFAAAIEELLRDARLWRRLSKEGERAVRATHDRRAAKARFLAVVAEVLARGQTTLPSATPARDADPRHREYRELVERIGEIVHEAVPEQSTVLVVSRGDDGLVSFPNRRAWHFPRSDAGAFAGHYPADSAAAIAHLKTLRGEGAEFLLIPQPAFWWVEHYGGFRDYLDATGSPVWSSPDCLIYRLPAAAIGDADAAP